MTRVLIVDDKEENLLYLQSLLGKHDYTVACARNGADALAVAQQAAPNLVISDLLMPVMDGYTLLNHWKTNAALKHIPFIVYTATFTDLDDQHFGESLGADAYILKPARMTELLDTVRQVIAKAASTPRIARNRTAEDDDNTTLKYYSGRLIRKLEDKTRLLERSNQDLQHEIEERRQADAQLRSNNAVLEASILEQKKLRELLEGEHARLVAAQQIAKVGSWEADLVTMTLIWSAGIHRIFETDAETHPATYAAFLELIHPDDRAAVDKTFRDSFGNNGDNKIRHRLLLPDGKIKTVEENWHTYGEAHAGTLRAIGTCLDITEHQALLESLDEKAMQLSNAQRVGRMGTWRSDVRTGRLIWTEATCALFGLRPDEFDGTFRHFRSFILPDDLAAFDSAHARASPQDPQMEMEYRIRRPNGEICWIYARGNVEFDFHGNAVARSGVVMDITEKKTAQEEIHGLGSRLIETFESISDGFVKIDGDWTFTYVNGRAERLLGRNRSELLGRNLWDEFKEIRGTSFGRNYEKVVAESVPIAFEEYYAPLDAWLEISAHPAHPGLAVYFRDVTARKETEAQLAYLRRVRAVLSGINALIVRVNNREELFREACHIAHKEGEFPMVMLCIVDPATRTIEPVASEGKSEVLMTTIRNTLATPDSASKTMVMRALQSREPVVCNDSARDERVLFGEQYRASGIQSMAVLPLSVQNTPIGVLALYAREIGFFQKDEMNLLVEMANDIAFAIDHIEKQERLDYLANFDTLTGLANRELFLVRLRQRKKVAAGTGARLCVALINLARFKNINDTLGRNSGDVLLRLVAEWLIRNAGNADRLARLGADEFAVVFDIKPQGDLNKLLESVNRTLEANQFAVNGTTLRIAARSGIAIYPDDGVEADTLLRNAEAALKETRARNTRYTFYTPAMNVTVASRLTLENQLRQATANEEFELYYQPKVNLQTGKVTGAEALLRWNAPHGELVLPGKFIPILEETGMIADVGHWALRTAIADYSRWLQNGLPAVRIAVNVSPLQLGNRNFLAELAQSPGFDTCAAAGLELEITEGMIMDDIQASTAILKSIRAMGIKIAIDDFGTGFSSLGYLAKLPVDALKIDRSFVIDMTSGREGLALVSTIIGLAHALNLKVVAEGVETDEQVRLLRLLNCDEMQGYALSRPVPVAELENKFLRQDFRLAV